MCFEVSSPLSRLKNILLSLDIYIVRIFLSGAVFSEIELGVSTYTASVGLKEVVNMKKTKRRENKSTIGVISMRGEALCIFIFDIPFFIS
jgi:hypothetical protein